MKILFDTNVVLDLLLDREPFSTASAELFTKVETQAINGYLCATTVTTLHYLCNKVVGNREAKKQIRGLLSLFSIAAVNRPVIELALDSKFSDFEDAVLHQSSLQVKVRGIVTRNIRDFKHANIPVYTPAELLQVLRAREKDKENGSDTALI